MNDIKDGGPAFPVVQKANAVSRGDGGGANYEMEQSGGMTLRDYFAAKAMQSMNSRQDYLDAPASAIALDAYALADALLKVRGQNE